VLQGTPKPQPFQGQVIFFLAVIIANCKIFILQHNLPLLQVITQVLSFGSYFITMELCSIIVTYMLYMIWQEMAVQAIFYMLLLLLPMTCIMFQVAERHYSLLSQQGYVMDCSVHRI
jgi:hypothetical protein